MSSQMIRSVMIVSILSTMLGCGGMLSSMKNMQSQGEDFQAAWRKAASEGLIISGNSAKPAKEGKGFLKYMTVNTGQDQILDKIDMAEIVKRVADGLPNHGANVVGHYLKDPKTKSPFDSSLSSFAVVRLVPLSIATKVERIDQDAKANIGSVQVGTSLIKVTHYRHTATLSMKIEGYDVDGKHFGDHVEEVSFYQDLASKEDEEDLNQWIEGALPVASQVWGSELASKIVPLASRLERAFSSPVPGWFKEPTAVLPLLNKSGSSVPTNELDTSLRKRLAVTGYNLLSPNQVASALVEMKVSPATLDDAQLSALAKKVGASRIVMGEITGYKNVDHKTYLEQELAGRLSLWDSSAGKVISSSTATTSDETAAGKTWLGKVGKTVQGVGERPLHLIQNNPAESVHAAYEKFWTRALATFPSRPTPITPRNVE